MSAHNEVSNHSRAFQFWLYLKRKYSLNSTDGCLCRHEAIIDEIENLLNEVGREAVIFAVDEVYRLCGLTGE